MRAFGGEALRGDDDFAAAPPAGGDPFEVRVGDSDLRTGEDGSLERTATGGAGAADALAAGGAANGSRVSGAGATGAAACGVRAGGAGAFVAVAGAKGPAVSAGAAAAGGANAARNKRRACTGVIPALVKSASVVVVRSFSVLTPMAASALLNWNKRKSNKTFRTATNREGDKRGWMNRRWR